MEKEIDRKTVVLQEDENVGSVKIADDVVATIARLAATEVEGVSPKKRNIFLCVLRHLLALYLKNIRCQKMKESLVGL